MINKKNVITIKVPFPNISSSLAANSHMYICISKQGTNCKFVKCQTFKPYMLIKKDLINFIDEHKDIARNPFNNTTRIDCDKIFTTNNVVYDMKLCTSNRSDICDELADSIDQILASTNPTSYQLNEDELISLNPLITKHN